MLQLKIIAAVAKPPSNTGLISQTHNASFLLLPQQMTTNSAAWNTTYLVIHATFYFRIGKDDTYARIYAVQGTLKSLLPHHSSKAQFWQLWDAFGGVAAETTGMSLMQVDWIKVMASWSRT